MNDWISSEPKMTEAKGNDDSGQSSNCNLQYLRANAIFMRATTFCKKDYLDSPAGMYALAMSRQCSSLTEDEMTAFVTKSMKEMDATVKSH